jgi:hypothetical protein
MDIFHTLYDGLARAGSLPKHRHLFAFSNPSTTNVNTRAAQFLRFAALAGRARCALCQFRPLSNGPFLPRFPLPTVFPPRRPARRRFAKHFRGTGNVSHSALPVTFPPPAIPPASGKPRAIPGHIFRDAMKESSPPSLKPLGTAP